MTDWFGCYGRSLAPWIVHTVAVLIVLCGERPGKTGG